MVVYCVSLVGKRFRAELLWTYLMRATLFF